VKLLFAGVTVNVLDSPVGNVAVVGETLREEAAPASAVNTAVLVFVVSAVAVTVIVYVPAAVGVQTTLSFPLFTQPCPLAGTTVKLNPVVTSNVVD
jgi:hypothetical protein